MQKLLYILLLLFMATGASAQNMPERSDVRRGNRQYNKGNYDRCIERYSSALEAVPGMFEATYDLGNALYKAERFDKAEQTMRQAAADSLRNDNERAEAFYNLGNAQFKQQKYKEALESYKQSLRLNPADREAKYNYAYTKRLLDKDKDGGGGDDPKDQKDQKDKQDQQNAQDQKDKSDKGDSEEKQSEGENPTKSDEQDEQAKGDQDPSRGDKERPGQPQPTSTGISPQEQEQMLDAIQAQEDRTQEKLKEKQGVVVRGTKNW